MTLASTHNTYALVLTPEEYKKVLEGNVLTHVTACTTMSGTWQLKFKKNPKQKHNRDYV